MLTFGEILMSGEVMCAGGQNQENMSTISRGLAPQHIPGIFYRKFCQGTNDSFTYWHIG